MAKTVKMVLYGEPGEGKSTFVSKAKNPFFITTDGNFEWLDLPEENHIQIYSFKEFKAVVKDMIDNPSKYQKFDTIAVDLVEDVFKWCEFEFCSRNKIEHVGDMGFGKGYDISRNEFYVEICKILGLDKHVVLIAHGLSKVETNKRGVQFNKYIPSERIPGKVWDMIEGRVRYFLRVFSRDEETTEGKFIKRRYLSLIPKDGEYGIARGLDESVTPEDIVLDWNTFLDAIGINKTTEKIEQNFETKSVEKQTKKELKIEPKLEVKQEEIVETKVEAPKTEMKDLEQIVEEKVDTIVVSNIEKEQKLTNELSLDDKGLLTEDVMIAYMKSNPGTKIQTFEELLGRKLNQTEVISYTKARFKVK